MRTRPLGTTGLQVSEIALGTVELGMDYGFRGSASHWKRPGEEEALRLMRRAMEAGINLFDTARAYGEAESVIGRALPELPARPILASKVSVAQNTTAEEFRASLHESLRALRVEAIDILQIHNTPLALLDRGEIFEWFETVRREGKVRFGGASFYDEPAARKAIDIPVLAALQVPFNLLDQKWSTDVFPAASRAGRGVLVRSAFLRGVLTAQVQSLDPTLSRLREAALRAAAIAGIAPECLAELALRFCCSTHGVSSVILGMRTVEEVDANVAAAAKGPLDDATMQALQAVSLGDDPLLNPGNWQGLI
jgi:aryl-alcohol dehydrogenase-like predicted oxidoreductase